MTKTLQHTTTHCPRAATQDAMGKAATQNSISLSMWPDSNRHRRFDLLKLPCQCKCWWKCLALLRKLGAFMRKFSFLAENRALLIRILLPVWPDSNLHRRSDLVKFHGLVCESLRNISREYASLSGISLGNMRVSQEYLSGTSLSLRNIYISREHLIGTYHSSYECMNVLTHQYIHTTHSSNARPLCGNVELSSEMKSYCATMQGSFDEDVSISETGLKMSSPFEFPRISWQIWKCTSIYNTQICHALLYIILKFEESCTSIVLIQVQESIDSTSIVLIEVKDSFAAI